MHSPIDTLIRAVASQPWLILPSKAEEIRAFLELRAQGIKFSADEIRARIGEPRAAEPSPVTRPAGQTVAVIPIIGIVSQRLSVMDDISGGGSASTQQIGRALDLALADPEVGAILLDVDSPGGTISGVAELAAKIHAARGTKPIVAIANSMAASAAYWIASAADEVVATPTALVGSIGVYTIHIDDSKFLEQVGYDRTVVKAGAYKAEGIGTLTDEARAALQQQVDDAYKMFVGAVAKYRDTTPAAVREGYGQGRALLAERALSEQLVDRIATYEETVARLANPRRAASIGRGRRMAEIENERLRLAEIAAAM